MNSLIWDSGSSGMDLKTLSQPINENSTTLESIWSGTYQTQHMSGGQVQWDERLPYWSELVTCNEVPLADAVKALQIH